MFNLGVFLLIIGLFIFLACLAALFGVIYCHANIVNSFSICL